MAKPKTAAERQRAFRERRDARSARMEAALVEVARRLEASKTPLGQGLRQVALDALAEGTVA